MQLMFVRCPDAMLYGFASGCNGGNPSSTSNLSEPLLDIAAFQLVRGRVAYLGHGWSGCDQVYERPAALDGDYGEPVGLCTETVPGESGVFTREYTKSSVILDCNTWSANITMKSSPSRVVAKSAALSVPAWAADAMSKVLSQSIGESAANPVMAKRTTEAMYLRRVGDF